METGLRCCYTGRFATTIFSRAVHSGGAKGAVAPARKTKCFFSNIVSDFAGLFLVAILVRNLTKTEFAPADKKSQVWPCLVQHNVTMLQQCCNYSKQCRNALLSKKSSLRIVSCNITFKTRLRRPLRKSRLQKEISVLLILININCYPLTLSNVGELSLS